MPFFHLVRADVCMYVWMDGWMDVIVFFVHDFFHTDEPIEMKLKTYHLFNKMKHRLVFGIYRSTNCGLLNCLRVCYEYAVDPEAFLLGKEYIKLLVETETPKVGIFMKDLSILRFSQKRLLFQKMMYLSSVISY